MVTTCALIHLRHTIISNGNFCFPRLYGIEIDDRSRPISAHDNGRQYALVMGNEDVGLSPQASAACDVLLEIPQASGDSLNVAVAASISMQVLGSKTEFQHDGLAACP